MQLMDVSEIQNDQQMRVYSVVDLIDVQISPNATLVDFQNVCLSHQQASHTEFAFQMSLLLARINWGG